MLTSEGSDVKSEKRIYCYQGENILRSLEKFILALSECFASFDDVNKLEKFERRAGPSKHELASNRVQASRCHSRPNPFSIFPFFVFHYDSISNHDKRSDGHIII